MYAEGSQEASHCWRWSQLERERDLYCRFRRGLYLSHMITLSTVKWNWLSAFKPYMRISGQPHNSTRGPILAWTQSLNQEHWQENKPRIQCLVVGGWWRAELPQETQRISCAARFFGNFCSFLPLKYFSLTDLFHFILLVLYTMTAQAVYCLP